MDKDSAKSLDLAGEPAELSAVRLGLELDTADYLPDLEGFDLTDAQKEEVLEALWSVLRGLVEMRVDVGAVDPCGQLFESVPESPPLPLCDVQSAFSEATEMEANERGKETPP